MRSLASRLLRLHDTPRRTAAAFALGVFFSFSPLLGLQVIIAMSLAYLLGLNRVAVFVGLNANLPWIVVPWYAGTTTAAAWTMGIGMPPEFRRQLADLFSLGLLHKMFWIQGASLVRPFLLPFLVGPTLGASVLGLASYPALLEVLKRRQDHQRTKAVNAKAETMLSQGGEGNDPRSVSRGPQERLLESTYKAEMNHFWFRGLAAFTEPLIEEALARAPSPEILDCGCGTGANMKRLSRHGRVTGFDLTWSGLKFAESYGQQRLVHASVAQIPFADERFDLVTAFDVFACLDDETERRALAEMHRVLRPGGALLVNTAALRILRGQHAVFSDEVRRVSRKDLRTTLERAGFEVVRLTYTNFTLLPIVLPVRLAQRVMGLTAPEESSADIVVPSRRVNDTLSRLLMAESIAVRHVDMPLGSSLLALVRKPGHATT